jgi:hypothetical protein
LSIFNFSSEVYFARFWTLIDHPDDAEVKRVKYSPRKKKEMKLPGSNEVAPVVSDAWLHWSSKKMDLMKDLWESYTPPDDIGVISGAQVEKNMMRCMHLGGKKKIPKLFNSRRNSISSSFIYTIPSITPDLNHGECKLEIADNHCLS